MKTVDNSLIGSSDEVCGVFNTLKVVFFYVLTSVCFVSLYPGLG